MSEKHPECPLYNHTNCREVHNPKLCAIVNENKVCLRKKNKNRGLQNAQQEKTNRT